VYTAALRTVRRSLKILAITGAAPLDSEELRVFAQQVGDDPIVPKPVRFAALHTAIQTLLRERARGTLSSAPRTAPTCNGLQSKRAGTAISAFLGPHYVPLSPGAGQD